VRRQAHQQEQDQRRGEQVKVTDEMVAAFSNADFTGTGNADWEAEHVRIGLAAVLDLIAAQPVQRFTINCTDDGDWFLIPVELSQQFAEYATGEREMDVPDGAYALGSLPLITFSGPVDHHGKVIT
jgi:hypothetical protein